MPCFLEVLTSVFIYRRVAAADLAARQAHAQMYPTITGLLAFLTAIGFARYFLDLIKVCAGWHNLYPP